MAGAAGVGLLALAQTADAKIIYHATHRVINLHNFYNLDLNHDGITDFILRNSASTGNGVYHFLYANPATNNGVVGTTNLAGWPAASALPKGAVIGSSRQQLSGSNLAVCSVTSGICVVSSWNNVTNRYLGLKFQIKGSTHYGWARLSVSVKGKSRTIQAVLTGYAYETVANKSIVAGKTKGADVVSVQPVSLGHLAQGASAISVWRTPTGRREP
jgi:hypothetical protein